MKKLFGLVALMVLSFILPARAETIKVVSLAVSEVYNSTDGAQFKAYLAANGDIDFGSFDFCKSAPYFINADFKNGETQYKVCVLQYGANAYQYFIYNADKYQLVNDPALCISGNNMAAVFQDVNGQLFALVSVRGTYKDDKISSTLGPVKTYIENSAKTPYPDAHIIVTYNGRLTGTYTSGNTYPDILDAYLVENDAGPQMIRLGRNSVGGFYTYSNSTPTSYSVDDADASSKYLGTLLTATYPTKYRVIFEDYDGTGLQTNVVNAGESVTPPTPPERSGFVFIGWDHDASEFANVTKSFTATAQYETAGNSYLVTYLGWDETMVDERAVEDGEKAEAIACPERAGYESLGWFKDGEPYDFNLPVTDDITLVATYRLLSRYEVGTVEELVNVLSIGLEPSVVCALTNDLDLTGSGYVASDFGAIFEGNGHSIIGFSDNMSLFKTVTGTIRNLCIRNADVKMSDYERGILGSQAVGARIENVTFENCKITGARTNAGFGLFFASTTSGELDVSTVISNCVARNCHALITSSGIQGIRCGGFVSNAGGQTHIVDCLFLSDNPDEVTVGGAGAMGAGSFACESVGTGMIIERCLSEGKVYAPRCYGNSSGAGGIVGGASGLCRVYDCTNRATVVGALQNGNGGIVGRGCKAPVRIYRSVNYGSVTTDPYSTGTNPVAIGAGGILGGCWGGNAGVTIVDCANFGAVSTTTNNVPAGGVIGSLSGQATCVSNCMNYASVFAPTNAAGGVIGNAVSSSFSIYNTGNAGDVSCPLGSAGGVIGKNEFLNNNVHDYVYGFMQCGTVSTGSGYAGEIVGLRVGAQNTGCSLAVKNGVLAGSVVAGDGGRTGLLVAGTSPLGTGGEVTYSVDEATHVLDTTLVHYYNKSDEPCSFVDPLFTMTAADLKRKSGAAKWLDDYAMANGHVRWVQTENYPELSIFAQGEIPEPAKGGMVILFR